MAVGNRKLQYAAGICATSTMIYQGIAFGWPSPAIPKLLNGEAGMEITKKQCSWVASLVATGAIFGCITAQYLGDRIGRRKTILLLNVPNIIGAVMLVFVKTPILLCISRIINGIGGAMAVVVVSIYIGEITDKEIRGSIGTLLTTMTNLGNLIMYAAGPYVSYNTLNLICVGVAVGTFFLCCWIPESPYYYLKNDNFEKAKILTMKFKGLNSAEAIDEELLLIQKQVQRDMERKTTIKELFCKKEYRKAVTILAGLKIMQQMTGTLVIMSYLETIFMQANMRLSNGMASLIYGVVQLFAGLGATVLVDKMGRKPLLLISSIGIGFSLTSVGIYFYMQDALLVDKEIMSGISWIPITGIIGFNILFVIGIGNLPYVLQSEIFPTNVKSAASSVATIFGASLAFGVTKTYQPIVDVSGIYVVFWMFACVSFAGVLFIYFVIPETKGKTLEEIQGLLNGFSGKEANGDLAESIPLQEINKKIMIL